MFGWSCPIEGRAWIKATVLNRNLTNVDVADDLTMNCDILTHQNSKRKKKRPFWDLYIQGLPYILARKIEFSKIERFLKNITFWLTRTLKGRKGTFLSFLLTGTAIYFGPERNGAICSSSKKSNLKSGVDLYSNWLRHRCLAFFVASCPFERPWISWGGISYLEAN